MGTDFSSAPLLLVLLLSTSPDADANANATSSGNGSWIVIAGAVSGRGSPLVEMQAPQLQLNRSTATPLQTYAPLSSHNTHEPAQHRGVDAGSFNRKQLEFVHELAGAGEDWNWWRWPWQPQPQAQPRPRMRPHQRPRPVVTENDLDTILEEYKSMVAAAEGDGGGTEDYPDSGSNELHPLEPRHPWSITSPLLHLQSELRPQSNSNKYSGHPPPPSRPEPPKQNHEPEPPMDIFLDGYIRPTNYTSMVLRTYEYGDGLLKCRACGGYTGSSVGECCMACGQLKYDGCWCKPCDCLCYMKSERPIRWTGGLGSFL